MIGPLAAAAESMYDASVGIAVKVEQVEARVDPTKTTRQGPSVTPKWNESPQLRVDAGHAPVTPTRPLVTPTTTARSSTRLGPETGTNTNYGKSDHLIRGRPMLRLAMLLLTSQARGSHS